MLITHSHQYSNFLTHSIPAGGFARQRTAAQLQGELQGELQVQGGLQVQVALKAQLQPLGSLSSKLLLIARALTALHPTPPS